MIRSNRGFTLMELLLVVAILAIVAAAAAPSFFGGAQDAMKEARKATFVSNFNSIVSAGNIYLANLQAAASGGGTAVTAKNIYSDLVDKLVSKATFSAIDAAGKTVYFTAEIIAVAGTSGGFRIAMYLGTATGAKKEASTPEITDPATEFAATHS